MTRHQQPAADADESKRESQRCEISWKQF